MTDEHWIKETIKVAKDAVSKGNHPFGALLVDEHGQLLMTAENQVTVPFNDFTAHAETQLVRKAGKELPREVIEKATLYTSTEPCVMCCGAICWAGIPRVVYGCGEKRLCHHAGDYLSIPCREIFSRCTKKIEVVGPVLEEEAECLHQNFWTGYDPMDRAHNEI